MTQTKQPKTAIKSSSHTPGRWEAKQAGPNLWVYAGDIAVAFIGGKDTPFTLHPNTPHKANARIIAQAPEMYELLEHLDSYSGWLNTPKLRDIQTEARRIKAAIDREG
jgi:hypothetical protein